MLPKFVLVVILPALCLAGQFTPAAGQNRQEPSPKETLAPSLKVGDPAPALKARVWLQGEAVKAFEPGKVYVVEFWSTTCGPCIAFMPHLAKLQMQYKDKGVTIIGCTASAFKDTEEKAAAFVKKRGPALQYRFAFATDRTFDAWMTAAGREGIPCTFVVDKRGQIAYIGSPAFLAAVLSKVVDGATTAKQVGEEMAKIETEFHDLSGLLSRDPKAGLKEIKRFEAKYPQMIDFTPWVRTRLSYLPNYGETGEATKYAETLVARAIMQKDVQVLRMASAILRLGDGKENRALLAIAVKAAEAEVLIDGGKDAGSLINLADTHFVSGDKAKAKEFARKANDAASGEPAAFRQYIAKEAVRLGVE